MTLRVYVRVRDGRIGYPYKTRRFKDCYSVRLSGEAERFVRTWMDAVTRLTNEAWECIPNAPTHGRYGSLPYDEAGVIADYITENPHCIAGQERAKGALLSYLRFQFANRDNPFCTVA